MKKGSLYPCVSFYVLSAKNKNIVLLHPLMALFHEVCIFVILGHPQHQQVLPSIICVCNLNFQNG